jgi:hypothetical protein
MKPTTHRAALVLLPLLVSPALAACGMRTTGTAEVHRSYDELPPSGRGLVIERDQLDAMGGALLEAIIRAQPQIRTEHTPRCPKVALRGPVTGFKFANPDVYVDGTRAGDTCILNNLSPVDVERVEIYPTGVTQRPGYATSPYGLILVFMRRL